MKILLSHYKCFGTNPQGFDTTKRLNILIGRNNSGKSSLLDVVSTMMTGHQLKNSNPADPEPEIHITVPLEENQLRTVFRHGTHGGQLRSDHWDFGKQWIGKPFSYKLKGGKREFVKIDPPLNVASPGEFTGPLTSNIPLPFAGKKFRQIFAERDIVPESDSLLPIEGNGDGATNLFQRYLNKAELPATLVEDDLLTALNSIMNPDSNYERVLVQQLNDSRWELFLEEENKAGLLSRGREVA